MTDCLIRYLSLSLHLKLFFYYFCWCVLLFPFLFSEFHFFLPFILIFVAFLMLWVKACSSSEDFCGLFSCFSSQKATSINHKKWKLLKFIFCHMEFVHMCLVFFIFFIFIYFGLNFNISVSKRR